MLLRCVGLLSVLRVTAEAYCELGCTGRRFGRRVLRLFTLRQVPLPPRLQRRRRRLPLRHPRSYPLQIPIPLPSLSRSLAPPRLSLRSTFGSELEGWFAATEWRRGQSFVERRDAATFSGRSDQHSYGCCGRLRLSKGVSRCFSRSFDGRSYAEQHEAQARPFSSRFLARLQTPFFFFPHRLRFLFQLAGSGPRHRSHPGTRGGGFLEGQGGDDQGSVGSFQVAVEG